MKMKVVILFDPETKEVFYYVPDKEGEAFLVSPRTVEEKNEREPEKDPFIH